MSTRIIKHFADPTKKLAFGRYARNRGQVLGRGKWLERVHTMLDVRKTRIDLSKLTKEQLRDVGLTRKDAEAECARPLWDVPPNWRQR